MRCGEHHRQVCLGAQEKLQQEKRATQETEYVLMHRLLSPVQSAVFILQARLVAFPASYVTSFHISSTHLGCWSSARVLPP